MSISKREKLLQSALILFSDNGVHSTSTASIAKHAGVANGTLFHHFESKLALVEALYISIKHQLSQVAVLDAHLVDLPLKQQVSKLWNMTIDWAIENPKALIFCQQVATSNILPLAVRLKAMKQELSILEAMITLGQSQEQIIDFPIDLMIDQCQAQIITSALFFISNEFYAQDKTYRDSAFELFWRAIAITPH